ncbi:MAG: hypothetical protein JWM27_991 [Gemmatimonadetes bacterium]|nr:hypothetical protein [Gemmatimonadota bacterium]
MRFRIPAAVLALLIAAAPSGAQTVRGRMVDGQSGAGLGGARVLLVDSAGRDASSATTDARGGFVLNAGRAGRFTVRTERIGYAATVTPPFALAAGETVERTIAATGARIALEGVVATGRQRCELRPGTGARTVAVWEEARKALSGARASAAEKAYLFELRRYHRRLDPRTEAVLHEDVSPQSGWSGDPFEAADPQALAANGFVQQAHDTTRFFAPDEHVLLSDVFLAGHCFRLQEPPASHAGWIGLAFEPVHGSRTPTDVRGVLWVDRATAELRSLEYRYTGLAGGARTELLSRGSIDFRRLPDGSWIVQRWRIRMPRVQMARTGTNPMVSNMETATLTGLEEEGGDVTAVTTRTGRPAPAR